MATRILHSSLPPKNHMKLPSPKTQSAFTLIELLVVISIIAILAGIALPVFGQVQVKGAQTKVLSNIKQVGTACRLFADDYNGLYPTYTLDENNKLSSNKVSDSNEAFAQLFSAGYMETEQIFFVAKSAFTPKPPDEKFKNSGETLESGENHFAYVLGCTTTSPATWPLIADGFASDSSHTYSKVESEKGGVWKGKKAIVLRCDNSGTVEQVNKQLKVPGNPNGNDLFDNSGIEGWMGTNNKTVNPK